METGQTAPPGKSDHVCWNAMSVFVQTNNVASTGSCRPFSFRGNTRLSESLPATARYYQLHLIAICRRERACRLHDAGSSGECTSDLSKSWARDDSLGRRPFPSTQGWSRRLITVITGAKDPLRTSSQCRMLITSPVLECVTAPAGY